MALTETGLEGVDWIQDRDKWWTLVNTVMLGILDQLSNGQLLKK
jgi:hypothetical protein